MKSTITLISYHAKFEKFTSVLTRTLQTIATWICNTCTLSSLRLYRTSVRGPKDTDKNVSEFKSQSLPTSAQQALRRGLEIECYNHGSMIFDGSLCCCFIRMVRLADCRSISTSSFPRHCFTQNAVQFHPSDPGSLQNAPWRRPECRQPASLVSVDDHSVSDDRPATGAWPTPASAAAAAAAAACRRRAAGRWCTAGSRARIFRNSGGTCRCGR